MKIPITACLLLLFVSSARAQNEEPARTDINPALIYYRAFILEPHLEQSDDDYLYSHELKAPLDEHFGKLIAKYDNEFRLVRTAAYSKVPCDWGIDWTPGPAVLLPQLARAKRVGTAAAWRAKWDLQNGRQDDAREDLLAALTLGRNTRDGSLISVLVQDAMENIICDSVAENFGRFSPEQLQKIVEGMDAGPARATAFDTLTSETSIFIQNWLLRKVEDLRKANPGDERKVMDGIRELVTSAVELTNFWPKIESASGGTSEGMLRLVQEYAESVKRMAAVIALPGEQFQAKEGELDAEITNSPNPFIVLGRPAFLKGRERELRVLSLLAMVHAAVDYKLHGESGLNSVPDPCGNGPFKFERFSFKGVDRGFKLTSAFSMPDAAPAVLIFVEKEGPPFEVDGQHPGSPPTP